MRLSLREYKGMSNSFRINNCFDDDIRESGKEKVTLTKNKNKEMKDVQNANYQLKSCVTTFLGNHFDEPCDAFSKPINRPRHHTS